MLGWIEVGEDCGVVWRFRRGKETRGREAVTFCFLFHLNFQSSVIKMMFCFENYDRKREEEKLWAMLKGRLKGSVLD